MSGLTTAPAARGATTGRSLSFRPDVEGLRAVAILAVVGYHAGLPFLPGGFVGVDVFFVISGFLITGLLVAEVARTGTVSLSRFWARRARRLLPAATLVIAVTAVASFAMIPAIDHQTVGLDLVASALYVANIRFAFQATDYLTEDAAPSPALHFWSLGVEEQFYVVWPLLVLLVVWLLVRRHRGRELLPAFLAGSLALLGIASFLLSLRLTDRSQPWAFFSMPTRAWEFAIGGLLAIGATTIARWSPAVRHLVGWAGLAVLVGSVLLLSSDTPFPGTAALWPVLGTAAIIAAGIRPADADRPLRGVPGLMGTGPMRAVGRISYSWYLWHWPVLVLAASVLGPLPLWLSVALAVASLLPAVAAYRWVEQPVRHDAALAADPGRSLRLGGILSASAAAFGLVLALLPGGGGLATVSAAPTADGDRGAAPIATARPSATPTPGAGSGSPAPTVSPSAQPVVWPTGPLTPDPSDARDDLPSIYGDGCHVDPPVTAPKDGCAFGSTSSDVTVVLIGDSHAAQWFPALQKVADDRGWRLLSWTKSGCPAPDVTIWQRRLARPYDECDAWREAVLTRLTTTTKPTLVVAAGTRTESLVARDGGARLEGTARAGAEWQDGWRRTLARLTDAGVAVAVLRDTPWPGRDMAACVGQNRDDPAACDVTRDALDATKYDVGMVKGVERAAALDLSDLICDADRCPATRGKYLVYRDTDHLTATFARALAPYLEQRLRPLVRAAAGLSPQ
ncbi:MAG: acyltransferase [Actinobacteria bacterium]|nr:acyltransferase [Actinomycetota bacterium]